MSGILDEILKYKRQEVAAAKARTSEELMKTLASGRSVERSFVEAIGRQNQLHIIAECKHKSPSRGVICPDYRPASLAHQYELGGATAISVLTDGPSFGGELSHLEQAANATSLPILRKDFVIDAYQIFETVVNGAHTFLLLAGVLDVAELQYFLELGREYGMEPLVEVHDEAQMEIALATDAQIVGINSRNLGNFQVSLENTASLAKRFADDLKGRILVCESGIRNRDDIETMSRHGFRVFLVGETLASAKDPAGAVQALLGL